MKAMPPPL